MRVWNSSTIRACPLPIAPLMHGMGSFPHMPLDQVQGEYTRLFGSALPHVSCPPYESAYREGNWLARPQSRWTLSIVIGG